MDAVATDGCSESADAHAHMGLRYRRGDGVQRNAEEAVRLFRLAADGGSNTGRLQLGLCYLDGEGVEEDEEEAIKLFRTAAASDYSNAQVQLGKCYIAGRGTERNFDEAVSLFRKAIEKGTDDDLLNLGSASKDQWVWNRIGRKRYGSSSELQTREVSMEKVSLGVLLGWVGY